MVGETIRPSEQMRSCKLCTPLPTPFLFHFWNAKSPDRQVLWRNIRTQVKPVHLGFYPYGVTHVVSASLGPVPEAVWLQAEP